MSRRLKPDTTDETRGRAKNTETVSHEDHEGVQVRLKADTTYMWQVV
jgi:hypothetical protein